MGIGAQLGEFLRASADAGLRVAAIGGVAINVHGYVRGTHDLDFLVLAQDVDRIADLLQALGYSAIDRREDLSSWVRGFERIDLLHARRPLAEQLWSTARDHAFLGHTLPVVDVEGILGFKIQAYSDDPRRLRDLADILELLKRHSGELDLARVRSYFRLFDQEALLDELLRQTAA